MARPIVGDSRLSREGCWAVGLFEGEGSILLPRIDDHAYAWLQLGSTDRDIVERFARIVECGGISAPQKPGKLGKKAIHVWRAHDHMDVRRILRAFSPHLGERRRKRAEQALAIAEDIRFGKRRITNGTPGSYYFRHREEMKAAARERYWRGKA